MRVLVTGATGFVGSRVCQVLADAGYEVTALSRDRETARMRLPMLSDAYSWAPRSGPPPSDAIEGADAIVNLMGESISGRWSAGKKERIYKSRVEGTRNLVEGIREAARRPQVLISQSAWGYYGDRGDDELTEQEPPGDLFLSKVCADWEEAAQRAETLDVRVVRLRTGLVVGPRGGFLQAMEPLFKFCLGGPLGSGEQWWSWVHRDDFARLIIHCIETEDVSGPLNAASPNPERQRDFAKALGRALRRPAFVPAPAPIIKLVLGEMSTEVLTSKRLSAKAVQQAGFAFTFPYLEPALRNVYGRPA